MRMTHTTTDDKVKATAIPSIADPEDMVREDIKEIHDGDTITTAISTFASNKTNSASGTTMVGKEPST